MPEEKKKVIVYSTPTCSYCVLAKNYFRDNKIKFQEVDVSKDPDEARKMVEKTGQMSVPQIEIDGKIIVGFDKEEIDKELELS